MRKLIALLALVLLPLVALAQTPMTGYPPYGSFQVDRFDGINRQNLNVNLAIPIVSVPGRGQSFGFSIVYDSLLWRKIPSGNKYAWAPAAEWGWKKEAPTGTTTFVTSTYNCASGGTAQRYNSYAYTDVAGTRHDFALDFYSVATNCNYPTGPREDHATDGSGIHLDATNPVEPKVTIPSGTAFSGGTLTDSNGNFLTVIIASSNPPEWHWIDTLGRIVLKIKKPTPNTTIEYHVLDQTGGYQVTTMTLTNFNIKTNFACGGGQQGTTEYTGSGYLPTAISLPNGQSYGMTYEDTPGFAGYVSARLKRITLPTGGYYEYQYPTTGNKGINCSNATGTSLTRVINDGVSAIWTFTRAQSGSNWDTTITAPTLPYDTAGNRSIFTYDSSGRLVTQRFYQGSSTLLKTVAHTWEANGTPFTTTTTLENNQQSKTETFYDDYGNLEEFREYDWGSGAPGAIIRTTRNTYVSTQAYIDRNIMNLLTDQVVREGGPTGSIKFQKSIVYDSTTLTATSGVVQHDYTNYSAAMIYRGNPTEIKLWRSTDGAWSTTTQWFDDVGNLLQSQDPMGHSSFFSYADSWEDTSCSLGPTHAFLTGVTNHLGHSLSTKYYSCTSQVARTTDPNSQSTVLTYDILGRLSTETRPDGGTTTYAYDDVARKVTKTVAIDTSTSMVTESDFDGLGRLSQTRLVSDPQGTVYQDTVYDSVGQNYRSSNPYRSTGEATYGVTETRYDGLGRVIKVIPPDGTATANNFTTTFSGNSTTVTDQGGKQKTSFSDAPGRLIQVNEPGTGESTPATAGTGSVAISGSLKSSTSSGTPGTGSVTISGSVQTNGYPVSDPNFIADSGDVYITVNGYTASASYSYGTTASNIASSLRSAFNNDTASPVTASGTGTTVTLTSKQSGANTNYSLSAGSNYDTGNFSSPSFTTSTSGSTLTGGSNGTTTYDNGNVWITVNGSQKSVNYGQGSTANSVASALRSAINGDATYPVTASGSGGTVSLTAKTTGASTNYSLTAGSSSNAGFSPPSFPATPSGSTLTGGADASGPAPVVTTYTYDVLDNLTQVVQSGSRQRTFTYNSLGLKTAESTPEAGSVTYTYNDDGNLLTQTDARSITITYAYDALHRLTSKVYSDGTPGAYFKYDSLPGYSLSNAIGRLVNAETYNGSTVPASLILDYDAMGRVASQRQCTPLLPCGTGWYVVVGVYNFAGGLTSYTNGQGVTFTQSFDAAGRVTQLSSSLVSPQHPGTLASGLSYNPMGALAQMSLGNGLAEARTYNNRVQPTELRSYNPVTQADVLLLTYGFSHGTANNGNVMSWAASGVQTFNRSYSYDEVNRLKTMTGTGGACTGLSWTYDIWGNRTEQTVTSGSCTMNSLSFNTKNQITNSGFSYDAAGNMISDGVYTYQYDAENRLVSVNNGAVASYTYDAIGRRVAKNTGGVLRDYVNQVDGTVGAENVAAGWDIGYVYLNGRLLAQYRNSTTWFAHLDHLGSTRALTAVDGSTVTSYDYLPYGENADDNSGTSHKFTGHERDGETGLDHTWFRQLSSSLGRWTSADPIKGSCSNPQTLNRYTYVSNNPTNLVDPTGQVEAFPDITGGGFFPGPPPPPEGGCPRFPNIPFFSESPILTPQQLCEPEPAELYRRLTRRFIGPTISGELGISIGESKCFCRRLHRRPVWDGSICNYSCNCDTPRPPTSGQAFIALSWAQLQGKHIQQYGRPPKFCPARATVKTKYIVLRIILVVQTFHIPERLEFVSMGDQ